MEFSACWKDASNIPEYSKCKWQQDKKKNAIKLGVQQQENWSFFFR